MLITEMVEWTEELESAWKLYADSHWEKPTNPNSGRLIDQLWSVKPMKHSRETFRKELMCNKNFFSRWMKAK